MTNNVQNNNDNNNTNNNPNTEEYTISITYDNDITVECAIIAIFPSNNRNYIALLPLTPVEGMNDEILLYRYSTIGSKDSIKLDNIESDAEYNAAVDVFEELEQEYENKKAQK